VATIVDVLTSVAAVTGGVMAGVFFAFSVAVVPALRRLPGPQGARTMQLVNRVILTPAFLLLFLAAAVSSAAVVVAALFADVSGAGWRVAGGLAYVLGAFVVTTTVNVPLNNALDAVEATSAEGERVWAAYVRRWTGWNHVRTVASVVATTLLVVGIS
jgi:uncharacterized membrane protein